MAEVIRLRAALRVAGTDAQRTAGQQATRDAAHQSALSVSRQETSAARASSRLAKADLAAAEHYLAELEAAKAALQASEERLSLAFEASGTLGWWDWDIPANRLFASAQFARMYGLDPAAAEAGAPLDQYVNGIHPDDRAWVGERIQQAIATAGEFGEEYRLLHPDGQVTWVYARGRCYHDTDGKPLRYPGVALDITARKRAEAAVQASEARLSTVIETVPVGILLAEAPSGRILMGNRRLAEMLGHSTLYATSSGGYGEFVAFHVDGRPVEPHEYPLARICAGDCNQARLEVQYQQPGGQRLWIAIAGEAIKDAQGRTVGAVVAVSDIAARKAAEAEQDILNRELSHRLKNTLALVQSIASQTLRNAPTLDIARDALTSRLVALGKAHDVLLAGHDESASVDQIVTGTLVLHDDTQQRFKVSGPSLRIGPSPALSLGLMLHELATNATKYGALSVANGCVTVAWSVTGNPEMFRLTWTEQGGPPVTPPTRKGFGSRLIQRGLAAAAETEVSLTFPPTGVVCTLAAPLAGLALER